MITNPEYLPKDRLKQELKKHGVSFSPNENKDYYVQLYREEVMQGKEPERGRSEFSSDEEFGKPSPRPSKRQTKNTPAKSKRAAAAPKIDTYLPQVETLSDKELSEQLQGYGESVGPVTATTRSVYERKLAKLMATEGPPVAASSSHEQVDHETMNESFIGEWSDDEEEESETEEAGSAPPPQRRVVTQSSRTKKQYTETVHVSSKGAKESNIRQRPSKPPSSSTPLKPSKPTRSGASSSTKRPSSSAGPSCSNIWSLICSILLIVLMFAIAFLVYEHYTCPEEQESLIISGWKKAGVLVVEMREWILKELPTEGGASEANAKEDSVPAGGTGGKSAKANKQPKKTHKSKAKKAQNV